jgi:hypothetical protein
MRSQFAVCTLLRQRFIPPLPHLPTPPLEQGILDAPDAVFQDPADRLRQTAVVPEGP